MEEVNEKRPKWICFKNFLLLLNCPKTQEGLAIGLQNYIQKDPGFEINNQRCEELSKKHFPVMLQDIRMFDIVDPNYWKALFYGVLAFLALETIVFFIYQFLYNFPFFIAIAAITIGLMLVIIFFLVKKYYSQIENPLKPDNYSWPVLLISSGLIALNFVLVWNTGWKDSPFLPAFFFTVITVVTAPRENSNIIYVLTAVSMLAIITPYLIGYFFVVSTKQDDYGYLSIIINLITLIFTVGLVIVSRYHSSNKVINNQRNE